MTICDKRIKFSKMASVDFWYIASDPENARDSFVEDFMLVLTDELQEFADYLVDNCIASNSTFPSTLWTSARLYGERTTNACESFHAFGNNFANSHPNYYVYIDSGNTRGN